jgi:ABC-type glutathione transport system ATPase component
MRLAFSVATALDPEILLIDEILAVGDAAFQDKCMVRLKELKREGKSIILVSHNSSAIEDFCDEAVWLDNARVRELGDPKQCIKNYLSESFTRASQGQSVMSFGQAVEEEIVPAIDDKSKNSQFKIKKGSLSSLESEIMCGSPLIANIMIANEGAAEDLNLQFKILTVDGLVLLKSDYEKDNNSLLSLKANYFTTVMLEFDQVNLLPGLYRLELGLMTREGIPINQEKFEIAFKIIGSENVEGVVNLSRSWIIDIVLEHSLM